MRRLLVVTTMTLTLALGLWLALGAGASTRKSAPASTKGRSVTVLSAVHTQVAAATVHQFRSSTLKASTTGSKGQAESGSESGSESENPGDNEADHHEDPPGQDVNHECPPDCDVANGEQP